MFTTGVTFKTTQLDNNDLLSQKKRQVRNQGKGRCSGVTYRADHNSRMEEVSLLTLCRPGCDEKARGHGILIRCLTGCGDHHAPGYR